jgi:hypothetical protein
MAGSGYRRRGRALFTEQEEHSRAFVAVIGDTVRNASWATPAAQSDCPHRASNSP